MIEFEPISPRLAAFSAFKEEMDRRMREAFILPASTLQLGTVSSFTIETLKESERLILGLDMGEPGGDSTGYQFGGMLIATSMHALQTTEERLFPASRHRSARIHKKLVKRHGGEFRVRPAAFSMGGKLVMHPAVLERLNLELSRRDKDTKVGQ